MIDINLLWGAIGAASMAFLYAISVYFSRTDEEKWQWKKALKTASMAAIVGFCGVYFNLAEDVIMSSPYYAFAGIVVERLIKIFMKRVYPWIEEVVGDIGW